MNLTKAITFLLCSTLLVGQTTPIRNPQIQGASGAIISGATLTNSGTFVNSGTINGAGTFNLGSGTVTLPASSVTSGNITDGAIVNADINASAAIDISKLASSAITIAGTSTSLGGSITASAILDSISSTQGTILYRGASGWSALSPGTSGHFLKTQGAGANPMWDAAAGSGSVATDALWDAAGDLAVGTGANTAARLAIGANGHVLTSNGTTASWAAPSGGAFSTLSDVDLTSIASGDMLKWNGTDWINRTAANVRTDLGLVIGTNVQAYDADLTTYAGITPSANVQSLLGAADYSAMRTQLGLGAAALLGTSIGGNGTADNGKVLVFDTGGHFHATTSISVNNSSATIVSQLRPDTLLLNSTGSGSHTIGGAATGARAHTLPDASGTLVHAATTLSGYGITDAQPLATILTTLSGLSNSSGVLTNNGSGTLSYTATTAGGNGTPDSGKIALLTADGGINLGKTDVNTGTAIIKASCDTGVGFQSVVNTLGTCFWAYPLGSSSSGFHAHVSGGTTGAIAGFDGDMSGGTGVNYLLAGIVRTDGLFFYGYEYETGVQRDRFAITATGDIHRYKNGTTFSTGSDKTILTFATPSGTKTITLPATTGTAVITSSGSVALTTDTTGNYVADVAGTSNEITSTHTPGEGSTATLSLPATIDLGGKTSFEIPNGAAPTVDAFGEIAGDNDLWAASRGAPVFFDGTASTALVNVLVSDAPSNGQVPKWNTGGTITWEADNSGGTISGTDTQVMFFDGTDTPAGDAGMTYNKTTNVLTAAGFVGALTGNASTATTLATARTINGVSFDGSANVADYATDSAGSDTYAITLSPAPGSYITNAHYRFIAGTANTGACTININSLGAKTIKKAAGGITTDLADNDIRSGQAVDLVYDGTNMQMQSTLGNAASGGISGLGSVDNVLVRTDGTAGTAAQGSPFVISDETTYSSQYYGQISLANGAQTNVHMILTPKGTGSIIGYAPPDGTTTGGNNRGTYSLDLQGPFRNSAADVASGTSSVIISGRYNKASGDYTFAGGYFNTVTGYAAFGYGYQQTASGNYTGALSGYQNTASGTASVVPGGQLSTASADYSSAIGYYANATRYGQRSAASGVFAALGDAQAVDVTLRCKTTTNSAVEMGLDGSTTYLTIPSGKVVSLTVQVTGVKSDGSAVAHYIRQYSAKNVGGTSSEVYAEVTIGTDNAAGTSLDISTVDAGDYISIKPTGVAAETWRWVARVEAVEVAYGN